MSDIYKKLGQRVRKLRERIGITQDELAQKLRVKRPAVSLIEVGERKVRADELIKLSQIFNLSIESLLDPQKEPDVILKESKKRGKRKAQIRISVPQKNLEKFREVLLYILDKVGSKSNVGETVIYKLLYFIDFDYYEKYEEQLIGATYQKNLYGPAPIEFQKIVSQMKDKEITVVKINYFRHSQIKYLPLRKPDVTKLKGNEIEVINDVLNRLSGMNATEISEYSHQDVPWLTTDDGEIIEYESVFYRAVPYSVREYADDVS